MGIVYMGTNGTRAAAIKVVREFLLEDPASRTRLNREVETLLRVKSDFVAEIVGSDIDGNPAWIATNYVDGPSLKILVEKEGALSEGKWIEFAKGFLSALSSVHAVGVVHRDIKPSNILLSKTGPKLIDFGISFVNDATSLTGTGMVAGTPAWLAPEQFLGREITTSVDNFAAGSTLMYAATGKTPWGAEDSSVGAIMHTILVEEPDLSSLTDLQIEIITPLLIKDVQSRKSAAQMLKRLNEGPRSINLRSKKESKSDENDVQNSFLGKARKQDLEDKQEKQEAENKQINEERVKKEREQAQASQKQEREQAKLAKDQKKIAKKQVIDEGKKRKLELREAQRGSKAASLEDSNTRGRINQKIIVAALGIGLLVIGGLFFLNSSKSGEEKVIKEPTQVTTYSWSALISGETQAQTGTGTSFEIFVCDQNVVASSIEVKNISSRPVSAGPLKAKVIKGDTRCGKDFDTVQISGKEASQVGSINYFVSGKTSSQYDFRYDFSVTISSN